MFEIECRFCGEQVERSEPRVFCSRSCAATYNNTGRRKNHNLPFCACGKRLPKMTSKFCSKGCRQEQILAKWLAGSSNGSAYGQVTGVIRNFLLEQAGHKCTQCGWSEVNPTTGRIPLEIDHKDGNSMNNQPGNLRVICPNCHSLTPTFRSLNRRGRKRRKSSQ